MTTATGSPVTQLLAAVSGGDASAQDRLWSLIYDEVRKTRPAADGGGVPRPHLAADGPGPRGLLPVVWREPGPVVQSGTFFHRSGGSNAPHPHIDDARRRGRLKRGAGQRPGGANRPAGPSNPRPGGVQGRARGRRLPIATVPPARMRRPKANMPQPDTVGMSRTYRKSVMTTSMS